MFVIMSVFSELSDIYIVKSSYRKTIIEYYYPLRRNEFHIYIK